MASAGDRTIAERIKSALRAEQTALATSVLDTPNLSSPVSALTSLAQASGRFHALQEAIDLVDSEINETRPKDKQ